MPKAFEAISSRSRSAPGEPYCRNTCRPRRGRSPAPPGGLHSFSETRAHNDDDTPATISYSGPAPVGDLGYRWDANKNKTSESIGGIMSGYGFTAEHDGSHRLHTAERGQLDVNQAAITAPQFNQCWTLDPTGNWQGFRQDDDGSGTWDLIQTRAANPVNEITAIDNTTGPSWTTPAYDANGNTTSLPRPDLGADKSTATIWDAWNRPVRFRDPDTDQTLVELGYNARNFRVLHRSFAVGVLGDTRHYYFTDRWQAVEERLGSSPAPPKRQHTA